jgi:hypothetical protein
LLYSRFHPSKYREESRAHWRPRAKQREHAAEVGRSGRGSHRSLEWAQGSHCEEVSKASEKEKITHPDPEPIVVEVARLGGVVRDDFAHGAFDIVVVVALSVDVAVRLAVLIAVIVGRPGALVALRRGARRLQNQENVSTAKPKT